MTTSRSRAVVDAAQTPPFLTDRRVVVAPRRRPLQRRRPRPARRLPGRSAADDRAGPRRWRRAGSQVVDRRHEGRRRHGAQHDAADSGQGPPGLDRRARHRRAASSCPARRPTPSPSASARTSVGSTASSQTLAATYGGSHQLGPADVEPFLGEGGGVPPWELTDAIDSGDDGAGARPARPHERARRAPPAAADGDAPRPLRPAGPPRRRRRHVEAEAAAVLGIKPGFPAKKALNQYRKLGGGGVRGRSTCWPPPTSTCGARGTCPTTW